MKCLLSDNAIGKVAEWLKCKICITSCSNNSVALSEDKPFNLKQLVDVLLRCR